MSTEVVSVAENRLSRINDVIPTISTTIGNHILFINPPPDMKVLMYSNKCNNNKCPRLTLIWRVFIQKK